MSSMQSTTRRKRTLENYLDSLGEEIPSDYNQYMIGGNWQDCCVFCLAPHNNAYRVFKFLPLKVEKKDIECFACADCGLSIDSMIMMHYPTEWQQLAESRSSFSSVEDDIERTKEALLLANNAGEYLSNVHLYYTHLNPTKDVFITNNTHLKCYCCNEYVQGNVGFNWYNLRVPVTTSSAIIGGKVRVCASCYTKINYESIITKLKWCTCYECGEGYYVDRDEIEARKGDSLFICTECAYKSVDSISTNSWLFLYENKAPRKELMSRFVPCTCDLCRAHFYVDLLKGVAELTTIHKSEGEFIKILCPDCATFKPYFDINRMTIRLNNHTILTINIDLRTMYMYTVDKIKLSIVYNLTVEIEDELEFMTYALFTAHKVLYGEQLTLEFND